MLYIQYFQCLIRKWNFVEFGVLTFSQSLAYNPLNERGGGADAALTRFDKNLSNLIELSLALRSERSGLRRGLVTLRDASVI